MIISAENTNNRTAAATTEKAKVFSPLTDISFEANRHARCTQNDGTSSELELYEGIPGHGDVCRNPKTGGFFCPKGCFPSTRAPFCVEKKLGFSASACRVNSHTSHLNGLRGNRHKHHNMSVAGTRVKVSNLPLDLSEKDLHDMFNSAGAIISATLMKNDKGIGTGDALLIYAHPEGAQQAIKKFNFKSLHGSSILVQQDIPKSPFFKTSTYRKQIKKNNEKDEVAPIPIFASPIMMFNPDTGLPYNEGEAPSIWSLLFPSLTSARWVDTSVDIYVLTNFIPHAKDMAELNRLNIKVLDMDKCFNYGRVKNMHESFQQSCPISGKDLGGSGIIGVTRFFAIQGAMEMLGLDMVFFLEGDNLLLRSTEFLSQAYKIRENKIDATITHISFHASFLGIDFVHQLNNQATLFADYTKKHINNQCFLTGGGQDMRLGYEGAKMLQVERFLKAGNITTSAQVGQRHNARILNTAGGTVPCDLKPRRWINALGQYCKMSGETVGPCALEPNLALFNKHNGVMWTSEEDAFEPLLYECDTKSIHRPKTTQLLDEIPGSLQQNLKGRNVKQSPGKCSVKDGPIFCEGTYSDNVHLSKTFYCDEEWITHGHKDQYNKALSFKNGRTYSATSSGDWIEHYNLHFQGGGCKKQMETVFSALKRSAGGMDDLSVNGFTCEGTPDLAHHEECMRDGVGAFPSLADA